MKVFTFGIGMFGFAVLNHISDNERHQFFAYEKSTEVSDALIENRKHPYFFQDTLLNPRVQIVQDYSTVLPEMDIVLMIIPYQFLRSFMEEISPFLKPGVILVNLSKGINNTTFTTAGEDVASVLGDFPYSYAVLSGGMIAKELVDAAPLGADIAITHDKDAPALLDIFSRKNLEINIIHGATKQVELAGALKNIMALSVGYFEGKGLGMSTIGYKLISLYKEIEGILPELGGDNSFSFATYAVGGDIVATCFGDSRNRYLGKLVGSGVSIEEALMILKSAQKTAEGYYTLQGLGRLIKNKEKYPNLSFLIQEFSV